ncbi:MAG: hypothetical protein JWN82_357 [Candidatus Saccharibacteria bacterium]|nr:hypothetical protein [Candidatus Saccharibacteria bacterium]
MSEMPIQYNPQEVDFSAARSAQAEAHRVISVRQRREEAERDATIASHQQGLLDGWVGELPDSDGSHTEVNVRGRALSDLEDYLSQRPTSEGEANRATLEADLTRIDQAGEAHEKQKPTSRFELMVAHAKAAKAAKEGDLNPSQALKDRLLELTRSSSDQLKTITEYRDMFELVDQRIARDNDIDKTITYFTEKAVKTKQANEARAAVEEARKESEEPVSEPIEQPEQQSELEHQAELEPVVVEQPQDEVSSEPEVATPTPRRIVVLPGSTPEHSVISFEDAPVPAGQPETPTRTGAALIDHYRSLIDDGVEEPVEESLDWVDPSWDWLRDGGSVDAPQPEPEHVLVEEGSAEAPEEEQPTTSRTERTRGRLGKIFKRNKTQRNDDGSRMTIDEIMANVDQGDRFAGAQLREQPVHRGVPQRFHPYKEAPKKVDSEGQEIPATPAAAVEPIDWLKASAKTLSFGLDKESRERRKHYRPITKAVRSDRRNARKRAATVGARVDRQLANDE